jgi:hypothetical protein
MHNNRQPHARYDDHDMAARQSDPMNSRLAAIHVLAMPADRKRRPAPIVTVTALRIIRHFRVGAVSGAPIVAGAWLADGNPSVA